MWLPLLTSTGTKQVYSVQSYNQVKHQYTQNNKTTKQFLKIQKCIIEKKQKTKRYTLGLHLYFETKPERLLIYPNHWGIWDFTFVLKYWKVCSLFLSVNIYIYFSLCLPSFYTILIGKEPILFPIATLNDTNIM